MIKKYFQDACFNSITVYAAGLNSLLDELKNWTDEKAGERESFYIETYISNSYPNSICL